MKEKLIKALEEKGFELAGDTDWYCLNHSVVNIDILLEVIELLQVPEIEFGQVVGSIGWAYEVAKREGDVYHNLYTGDVFFIDDFVLKLRGSSNALIFDKTLTGWHRKFKTAKEELIDELRKICGSIHRTEEDIIDLDSIVSKYNLDEVTKNE